MIRYYLRVAVCQQARPSPLLLRVRGPLVILSTLTLLGTGVALMALVPVADTRPLLTGLDRHISPPDPAPIRVRRLDRRDRTARPRPVPSRGPPRHHVHRIGLALPGQRRGAGVLLATAVLPALVAMAGLSPSTAWTSRY